MTAGDQAARDVGGEDLVAAADRAVFEAQQQREEFLRSAALTTGRDPLDLRDLGKVAIQGKLYRRTI